MTRADFTLFSELNLRINFITMQGKGMSSSYKDNLKKESSFPLTKSTSLKDPFPLVLSALEPHIITIPNHFSMPVDSFETVV